MKWIRPTPDGRYRVRLAAAGSQVINLSGASLAMVDHPEGTEAVVTPSGIYVGAPGRITSAAVNGVSRTSLYQSGDGAISESGETINLELSHEGTTLLVLDLAARPAIDELPAGAVDVQTQDNQGKWTTVASIIPRRGHDKVAVEVTGAAAVCLRVGRPAFIRSISTLTGASAAEPTWLDLSSLQLSAQSQQEPGSISLAPGEHAVLTFSGVAQTPEGNHAGFLRVTSRLESTASYRAAGEGDLPVPQIAFSLAMRPNPAAGRVAVDFSMPRDMDVSIKMYDAAGRLVRTLTDGLQTAGSHSVVWDGRNDAGASVRGGLYFCKMDVGDLTSMKKVVFLSHP